MIGRSDSSFIEKINLKHKKEVKVIKNKILWLALIFLFAIIVSGGVSATNSTDGYVIGQNVTQQTYNDVNFGLNQSEKNLVITTAGSAKLNNQTTEKSLSGIIDNTSSLSNNQKITYGNGNLVQINDPFGDLKYIFVSKMGSVLKAKKFLVTSNGSSYTISSSDTVFISAELTPSQWNYAKQQLGDDLFSIASIANAWSNGAPIDLLTLAESNGKIAPGTISGYALTNGFIKQYPNNSSKEYYILTVPGGYDDNGPIYFMPWNYNLVAIDGLNPLESAYIQWDTSTKKGTLALVKFNENLYTEFKTSTGITVVDGTSSEIKFNNWLLNLLKNNPGKLLTIEKTAIINQTDLTYLAGNSTQSGKGLNETVRNYIFNLTDASAPFNVSSAISDDSKYAAYVTLGQSIAQQAKNVLTALPGTYGNVAVSTAPVYATAGRIYIRGFYDGFASVLGTDPNNIISLRNPYNFDSYVNHYFNSVFYIKGNNGTQDVLYAIQVQYNTLNDTLTWSNPVDLSNGTGSPKGIPGISNSTGKDQGGIAYFTSGMGSMPWAVMGYLWTQNISYDVKKEWNIIGHCMSGPAILAVSQYILSSFPLGPDEHYIQIGQPFGNTISNARNDNERTLALDAYPGLGNFYTGDGSNDNEFKIAILNERTGNMTIYHFAFNSALLTTLRTNEKSTANSAVWYADVLSGHAITTFNDIFKGFNITKIEHISKNQGSSSTTNTSTSGSGTGTTSSGETTGHSSNGSVSSVSAASSTSSVSSQSVGDESGQTTPGQDANSAQNGKVSEISTVDSNSSSGGSGSTLYIVIGITILAILVVLGFFKSSLMGLIK